MKIERNHDLLLLSVILNDHSKRRLRSEIESQVWKVFVRKSKKKKYVRNGECKKLSLRI